MQSAEILSDIHVLEEDLLMFERNYGIRSDVWFAAYISGEEASDDAWILDFQEWASVYRTWLERQAQYRTEIQRINPRPSVFSLIRKAV
jgi:hypothetical protein